MTRNLYLIRHGRVDFRDGIHRCIGRTDTELDETGRSQARALADYFAKHPVECIFSSPLSRAVETARLLSGSRYPVKVKEGLAELDMGEWENLPLKSIKKDLETEPVRGEKRQDGLRRFAACIEEILESTEGDVAVTAHAGINCCYLAQLLDIPLSVSRALPQPYGGFSRIEIRGSVKTVAELGRMAAEVPSTPECEAIWEHCHTPEQVREHCRAVSELACEYGRRLREAGMPVDRELIRSAALLHDVMRQKRDHPLEGARAVVREGYPGLAPLLIRHHDWNRTMAGYREQVLANCRNSRPEDWKDPMFAGFFRMERARQEERQMQGQEQGQRQEWQQQQEQRQRQEGGWHPEAAVLYLADKEILGTRRVTLEERFEQSRQNCLKSGDVQAALAAHMCRYREAGMIRDKIYRFIGGVAK